MQQGIMGSHASPDLWISAEKTRSAELRRTFCDVEFRRKNKSAEILGKTIESAEVHYTFCDVEFRRTIGLHTKFRPFFFSRSHALSCPIIGRNGKKAHKVRRDLFGKLIWDFNAKFWALDPTLLIGHGWHMWSGGACLGNPWKIV